ncbi:hypothetical protein [Aureimonas sp. AU12]|uniref:hypothetical protein n=1 Tax=Aureimonas sp. AU12 TaxID=1638161 RepID=UPI000B18BA80|nr:hypothetical protein [Aureimonas sp. AU12]
MGMLVPSLPGDFGAYEFFGAQGFSLAGVEPSPAAMTRRPSQLILLPPTIVSDAVWLL